MTRSAMRIALVLGILTAIAPVAVDMYLPALPTIAADLGTDAGTAQLSLVAVFVALAVGQPIYGPLSDAIGRKPPLYGGLALFVLAAAGCLLVTDIHSLIVLRFIQGFGLCATIAVVRACIRDMHTGPEAAQLIAFTLLVLSVSPILAPLAGSAVIAVFPWQAIFVGLTLVGLLGLACVAWLLPETLPPERRKPAGIGVAFASYARLFRDGRFMGLTFVTSFAQGSFFAYIVGSAFFFIDVHGLEPWLYSVVFAVNAIGLIVLAQFNANFMRRFGAAQVVLVGVTVNAAVTAALLATALLGVATLPVALVLLFLSSAMFGLVIAPGSILALDAHGAQAGAASALMGTLQFAFGAIASGVASLFFDGTELSLFAVMAACALAALLLSVATLRRKTVI